VSRGNQFDAAAPDDRIDSRGYPAAIRIERTIMVGITARLIAGTVLGVLFLCAFAIGMVCDLLNHESQVRSKEPARSKKREHGTAARSAESLQRVFHLGRDQA
jgi:hypothetical protein